MNPSKLKELFALLTKTNLNENRKELVASFSNGRTESCKGLKEYELKLLITYLRTLLVKIGESDFQKGELMRKKIMSLCHQYDLTSYCPVSRKNKVDLKRLNNWMLKYSYLHKPINKYTNKELTKLVTQFETVVLKELQLN